MTSQKNDEIDDAALLQKFYSDQDNKWLGLLLPRYTLLLLGVCMKYLKNEEDAKDSVQQIFLKVISELHKYKVEYFKSWIYMIAKNHCLMKLRDKNKIFVEIHDQLVAAPDNAAEMNLLIEKNNNLNDVEEALKQLNTEQKLCITLFYLQKKSYSEITQTTGYNMMQVKSYIQNGKRNLRQLLENNIRGGRITE